MVIQSEIAYGCSSSSDSSGSLWSESGNDGLSSDSSSSSSSSSIVVEVVVIVVVVVVRNSSSSSFNIRFPFDSSLQQAR